MLIVALPPVFTAHAQVPDASPTDVPETSEVLGIVVRGTDRGEVATFVQQTSGLAVGQKLTIPGDPAISEAVRNIYEKLGLFSDVKIVIDNVTDEGVYIGIEVKEEPKISELNLTGIKKGQRKDLKDLIPLKAGRTARPSDVEQAKQVIKNYFAEKGYLTTETVAVREENAEKNTVDLTLKIDRGPRVEVGKIIIKGNDEISDRRIRKQLKETKEDRWWKFWKKSTFDERKYEDDLQNVLNYYYDKGFYDARIVGDSVYVKGERDPEVVVEMEVAEGPRYHVRNVDWEGNTVYPDEVLTNALGIEPGDTYNKSRMEQNLYGNKQSSDVASLYMNRGYMRFSAEPSIRIAEGDSLDISFDVTEGDVYTFGDIDIAGNTKTKEHVIRRELYTVPGQTFSRESIQESIRRLSQLSYFSQESLAGGPGVEIDEANKQVDLSYRVDEVGSDQLELSGTWGRYGLILMLRFGFNNFSAQRMFDKSAWKPLPAGDGQKLSVGIQTNGSFYQSYSLSFTEPWFRGRPTPIGFSLSHSRLSYYSGNDIYGYSYGNSDSRFITSSGRFFFDRRLKWPDDYFNSSTAFGYQYYLNRNYYGSLPEGVSQEINIQQAFSRSSLDNPMFPMRGSSASLSLKVAPPIPGFLQYHKWRFTTAWNVPVARKVSVGFGTDFGYVGSLTGDRVKFERFDVGGSPFETQGYYSFGTDIVYMRGYPRSALSPRGADGSVVGGTILNKFTSELRWLAVQSPQIQAAPYLFLDAANTWNGFQTYNPAELYRSAGVGVRLFLPIVGMLELTYGYNFDEYIPTRNSNDGMRDWSFQFSLGQSFGQ